MWVKCKKLNTTTHTFSNRHYAIRQQIHTQTVGQMSFNKRQTEFLRDVRWFKTDVSGLPIYPMFKGQTASHKSQTSDNMRNYFDLLHTFIWLI